jgi:hypothetical protein
MRNFGWECKGRDHRGNRQMQAGVPLYYCRNCGIDPANEYCLNCASNMQWQCPRCNGRLIPG